MKPPIPRAKTSRGFSSSYLSMGASKISEHPWSTSVGSVKLRAMRWEGAEDAYHFAGPTFMACRSHGARQQQGSVQTGIAVPSAMSHAPPLHDDTSSCLRSQLTSAHMVIARPSFFLLGD